MTTTTNQTVRATEAQVRYINDLRDKLGEDAFLSVCSDLGCDTTPKFLVKSTATKVLDRLIDLRDSQATPKAALTLESAGMIQGGKVTEFKPVEEQRRTRTKAAYVERDEQAAVDVTDMTGKVFAMSVADGYAKYKVVRDVGGFCTIEHVPDAHTYRDALLGDRAVISRDNVANFVAKKGWC